MVFSSDDKIAERTKKLRMGKKSAQEKWVLRYPGIFILLICFFFITVVFLTAGGGIVSWRLFGFHLARFN